MLAHDSGKRVQEAPKTMLIAMGIAAFLCVGIGVFPEPLYALLPHPVDYHPYTTYHVMNQLQLLFFSALAFIWLMRSGVYPTQMRSINLDFDYAYRTSLPAFVHWIISSFQPVDQRVRKNLQKVLRRVIAELYHHSSTGGALARTMGAGGMVFWVLAMLALYLLLTLAGR